MRNYGLIIIIKNYQQLKAMLQINYMYFFHMDIFVAFFTFIVAFIAQFDYHISFRRPEVGKGGGVEYLILNFYSPRGHVQWNVQSIGDIISFSIYDLFSS